MAYKLSVDEELILKSVREFAEEELRPLAKQIDITGKFPKELVERAAELGLYGMSIDPEYGGLGLKCTVHNRAMEILAKECPALALSIDAHLISAESIHELGTEAQKKKYLPRMAAGEMIGANVFCEAPGTTNFQDWGPMAEMTEDGSIVFNTTKVNQTNCAFMDVMWINGFFNGQLASFVLDTEMEGVNKGTEDRELGLHGIGHGTIRLVDVKVTPDTICIPENFSMEEHYHNAYMYVTISSIALGIMESAYEKTKSYLMDRKKSGKPFAGIQKVAHRLTTMKMQIETCRSMIMRALELHDENDPDVQLDFMTKAYVTAEAVKLCNMAIQLHGGVGINEDSGIPQHLRDIHGLAIGELPYDVLLDQIALLEGFPIDTSVPFFPSAKTPKM